jgi:hypothetical protein
MDVDRREINRLHLPTAAAKDIKPAVACIQRRANRRGSLTADFVVSLRGAHALTSPDFIL